jgi:hypothetical protein
MYEGEGAKTLRSAFEGEEVVVTEVYPNQTDRGRLQFVNPGLEQQNNTGWWYDSRDMVPVEEEM